MFLFGISIVYYFKYDCYFIIKRKLNYYLIKSSIKNGSKQSESVESTGIFSKIIKNGYYFLLSELKPLD